jgi:hypothetical protein
MQNYLGLLYEALVLREDPETQRVQVWVRVPAGPTRTQRVQVGVGPETQKCFGSGSDLTSRIHVLDEFIHDFPHS